jgi:choline dehydrogenase-like flavoprotein
MSPAELALKAVVEERYPERRVIVSRGIRAARHAEQGEDYSRLSSLGTTLKGAAATGRLTLRADALVARLLIDDVTGRASGVEYIDRKTGALHACHARIVVLCASTIETVRILMATTSKAHPNGVGASSGLLGRGLMDHIVSCVYFITPEVKEQGGFSLLGSDSIVIPRWQNLEKQDHSFLRGFGIWGGIERMPFPAALKKTDGASLGFLCAMGETLPHDDNHMRLDTTVKDRWGLAVPHISCEWTENDIAVSRASREAATEMIVAAGGVPGRLTEFVRTPLLTDFTNKMNEEWTRTTPGLFVHEVGGARMGEDPKTSVTNPTCQVWDAPNVILGDGATWVSSGWQNPTLTEMAICARACASAVDQLKRGDL